MARAPPIASKHVWFAVQVLSFTIKSCGILSRAKPSQPHAIDVRYSSPVVAEGGALTPRTPISKDCTTTQMPPGDQSLCQKTILGETECGRC
eukprot:2402064-Rhodomonas_salina.1